MKRPIRKETEYCTLAHPGTYNHECGRDAAFVAVIDCSKSEYSRLIGGFLYVGRCEEHAHNKTLRDNHDLIRLEPLNQPHQVNRYR